MKLITEFENYVLKYYLLSESNKTISEDGRTITYTLLLNDDKHVIKLKQVNEDYFSFEFYFKKTRIQSSNFFENETHEEKMTTLKALFDYTFDAYKISIRYIY